MNNNKVKISMTSPRKHIEREGDKVILVCDNEILMFNMSDEELMPYVAALVGCIAKNIEDDEELDDIKYAQTSMFVIANMMLSNLSLLYENNFFSEDDCVKFRDALMALLKTAGIITVTHEQRNQMISEQLMKELERFEKNE